MSVEGVRLCDEKGDWEPCPFPPEKCPRQHVALPAAQHAALLRVVWAAKAFHDARHGDSLEPPVPALYTEEMIVAQSALDASIRALATKEV